MWSQCCLRGAPPSPDNLIPRPVLVPESQLQSTATFFPPWSTLSGFSKPEDAAELQAIFDDDKSESSNDHIDSANVKEGSSTFSAVRTRFIKRLSRESPIENRHSRSNLGTSEESERRAELRRLRIERIRKELGDEGIYDEDATQLSLVSENKLRSILSYKSRSQPLSNANSGSPTSIHMRRFSSPNISDFEIVIPSRKRSSIPTLPVSPTLEPKRLPSIPDPTATSWRLSFSADNRAARLRTLSQGSPVPYSLPSTGLIAGTQPVKTWLQSQSPRTPAQKTGKWKASPIELEDYSRTYSNSDGDLESLDGTRDSVHLHEMKISERLAPSTLHSYSSSPQLSTYGSRGNRNGLSVSTASKFSQFSRSKYFRSTSGSVSLSEIISSSLEPKLEELSKIKSPQATQSSEFSLSPPGAGVDYNSVDYSTTNTLQLSSPNTSAVSHQGSQKLMLKNGASLISETESSRECEIELQDTRAHFAISVSSRSPSTPVSSKFVEDFAVNSTTNSQRKANKSSPFSRLTKAMSKAYDGSTDKIHSNPSPEKSGYSAVFPSEPPSPSSKRPDLEVLQNGQPGRPILEFPGDNKSERGKSSLIANTWRQAARIYKGNQHNMATAKPAGSEQDTTFEKTRSMVAHKHIHGNSKPKGKVKDESTHINTRLNSDTGDVYFELEDYKEPKAIHIEEKVTTEKIAQESHQRTSSEVGASEASVSSLSDSKKSWARFASHIRNDRGESAELIDRVATRDFAETSQTRMAKVVHYRSPDKTDQHCYLFRDIEEEKIRPTKLSSRVKSSLYKLHARISAESSDEMRGRKSSISLGGSVEEPDLELLPVGGGLPGETTQLELEIKTELDIDKKNPQSIASKAASNTTSTNSD